MLNRNYLRLQLSRLRNSEEWGHKGAGLLFVLPSSGSGQYVWGSVARSFSAGDVLVMDGASAGVVSMAKGVEIVLRSFSAQLEHLFPLFAEDEIWLLEELRQRFKTPRFYAASSPVAKTCHKLIALAAPQFNLGHRTHLLEIVATIFSAELDNVRPRKAGFVRIEEHLEAVFDNLTIDEVVGLPLDELAARFNCSRRHLNRLFHQHLGLSVSMLRMEMRLLKAATLLRDSDAKVISVAETCGFNHLGLFNTCFKRRFGATPGVWRKQFQPGNDITASSSHPVGECQLASNGLCPWSASSENVHVRPLRAPPTPEMPPKKCAFPLSLPTAATGGCSATSGRISMRPRP